MYSSRLLTFLFLLLSFVACNQDQKRPPTVTATVTDQNGDTLPNFSLQLINASDTWTGKPYIARSNNGNNFIHLSLPQDGPVVLKFAAPGYQPLYTFLIPVENSVKMSIQLGAPTKVPDNKPVVVGSFNNFDSKSGNKMSKQPDGSWTTEIKSDSDTLLYAISRFILGGNITGTKGNVVFQKDSRGVEPSYVNLVTKSPEESAFQIQFDPTAYQNIFESAQPKVNFLSGVPKDVKGIAKIYTLMIEEYWDLVTARGIAHMKGEQGFEYNFSTFLNKIDQFEKKYSDASVSKAAAIAKLRLLESDALTPAQAKSFLNSMNPDSPIWLMHFPILTTAVNLAGLENSIDDLSKIVNQTPYKALRGEALYNRLRYYYKENNGADWHSNFTRLVSNHPNHFRTTYAYNQYAPEKPISKGEPLLYTNFDGLQQDQTIKLSEIEESYLLLDFWATWCGPCIESLPNLKKVYEEFSKNDFSILSISIDENRAEAINFLNNEFSMPWYHAFEKQGSKKVREMGIVGVPYYILLGPDRKVITQDQSKLKGDSLSITIKKYLDP